MDDGISERDSVRRCMSIDDKPCRPGRSRRRRLRIDMPVHALVVGCVLGLGAAVSVVHILAALWNSFGIGINAGANTLTLVFLYAPAVVLSAGRASALVFGVAVVVTLVLAGLALFVGSDFGADHPYPELQASASAVPRCGDR
jgi:hypothetical protein